MSVWQRITETERAAGVLRSGGILVLPTDTLPGIHGRADDSRALDRILELKMRPTGKPMLVLAASVEQALELARPLAPNLIGLCRRCWPGPFSLILPACSGLPEPVTGTDSETGEATVAVRVPAPEFLRELILATGGPLASTSVNRAGEPPLTDLAEAADLFADQVDGLWVPDGWPVPDCDQLAVKPSALVDGTVWPPRLLRSGPLDLPL